MVRSVCRSTSQFGVSNPLLRANTLFFGVILWAALCALAFATDNEIKSEVEFKTQAPLDTLPETTKDCYEYLYGKLSAIRRHGTTWQNGEADCSNCTCDNGDIRCFFHFCNGPSTGYMTPPTTDDEELDLTEESSGYPPPEVSEDDGVRILYEGVEWPPDVLPKKWQNELSGFETSSKPSAVAPPREENVLPLLKGEQHPPQKEDRTENETHDVLRNFFCGKSCKRVCPQGFKVDPVTGCWKCLCRGCPSHTPCEGACPFGVGRMWDENGCETCPCKTTDGDITFSEVDVKEEENSSMSGENNTSEDVDDEEWLFSKGASSEEEVVASEMEVEASSLVQMSEESSEKVTSFPNLIQEVGLLSDEEPCNKTELRGCFDGTLKFNVGETWSRGPCVSCRCMAPGYSECNITQCHVPRCPVAQRYTPEGACCALCKELLLPMPPHEEEGISTLDKDLLPSNHAESEPSLWQEGPLSEEVDEATVKSVHKDENSHLLLILIPMGVLLGVCALLSAHFWRRYHRDKYNINAYRPEEKQKLRPVKTLCDDSSSLGNVC